MIYFFAATVNKQYTLHCETGHIKKCSYKKCNKPQAL